jgi:hypothetical protein
MVLIEFYLCHPRDGTADTAPWYYGAVDRTIGYHVLVNSKKGLHFGIQSDRAEYGYCALSSRKAALMARQSGSKRIKVRSNLPKAQFPVGLACGALSNPS